METPVTAFLHIEIVHPDPTLAAKFMEDVLGAERVEKEISDYIEGFMPGVECIHMKMGNVIFQFIKPNQQLESWTEQLGKFGPGVHNVSMQVKDADALYAAMLEKGCKKVFETVVNLPKSGPWSDEPDAPRRAYVVDAIAQTGLRFEMVPR